MPDLPVYVLDSYAILALFGAETGADQVQALLHDAAQSKVHVYMSQRVYGKSQTDGFGPHIGLKSAKNSIFSWIKWC